MPVIGCTPCQCAFAAFVFERSITNIALTTIIIMSACGLHNAYSYCLNSFDCRMELELAHGLKKPIIPVLLEAISWPPEGVAQLAGKLAVDFTEDSANIQSTWTGAPFDKLVKRINKTVKVKG